MAQSTHKINHHGARVGDRNLGEHLRERDHLREKRRDAVSKTKGVKETQVVYMMPDYSSQLQKTSSSLNSGFWL